MDPSTRAAMTHERSLWDLLDEHDGLKAIWRESRDERDRRSMAAAWSIGLSHAGSSWAADRLQRPEREGQLCRPSVVSCHWLPAEGEDYWTMADHLGYRGCCLSCGWVSARARRGRGAENLAVEDAHDHTHPTWRETPILPCPPCLENPTTYERTIARWYLEWGHLLPEGWLDRGGPIRTSRSVGGDRHVPGRAPGGGYDLGVVAEDVRETDGGQLCLL